MPQPWIGALALAASALGGALAPTEPTGNPLADALLTGGLTLLLAFVASRAHPAAVIIAATAAAATGSPLAIALAAACAVLTLWRPAGWPAPIAGAALANALVRLAWPDHFAATALVVAAVATLLLMGAWPRLPTRATLATGGVVLGVGAISCAGLALTLASRADDLRSAVRLSETALASARTGDTRAAAADFDRAGDLLRQMERDLQRWWVRPAAAIPIVAQHLGAIDDLTALARRLTAVGHDAAEAADPSKLTVTDGAIDLVAIGELRPSLIALSTLLANLPDALDAASSPWLLDRLRAEMDDLEQQAAEQIDDVSTAINAAGVAPWLLGEGGERRYFLAVANPAENRGGGGFIGNWGILTATDGRLALPRFGRIAELYRDEPYDIDVNPEWNARYVDGWSVDEFPQNVLGSPHLPDNAEAIRQIAGQAGLGRIDGVITLDPFAMAGFLALTGPMEIEGWPEPLTSDNAARVLLHEQYLDAGNPGRVELLERTTNVLFSRLTNQVLPSPAIIAETLGPVVSSGHLQMSVFDEPSSAFLHVVDLERRMEPPAGDSFGLVTASAVASKLDWFLRRSVTYNVRTDADTGVIVGANAEVMIENLATADLEGDYFGNPVGENRQLVSVYTTFSRAAGFLDGEPIDLGAASERGHRIFERFVTIPPGETATLRFELEDPLASGAYSVALLRQPSVGVDQLRVVIDGKEWFTGPLTEGLQLARR